MKTSSIIWLVVILAIVIIGGIWIWMSSSNNVPALYGTSTSTGGTGAYNGAPSGTSGTPSGSGTAATPLTLNTASDATLGTYLVATNGMTLYRYTKDTPGKSNCTGACSAAWPPYTVSSADTSTLAAGISIGGQLSTVKRTDGSFQLAYNGIPLYFFAKDKAPGDIGGQGVGGVWFVVNP